MNAAVSFSIGAAANDQLVVGSIETHHVERIDPRNTDAPPLADRMPDQTAMLADFLSVSCHDIARHRHIGPPRRDKIGVGTLAHKADFLALSFVRDRKSEVTG